MGWSGVVASCLCLASAAGQFTEYGGGDSGRHSRAATGSVQRHGDGLDGKASGGNCASERGYYIHPDLYGAPEEKGIEWERHPGMMKRMKELREKQSKLTAEKQAK